MFSLFVARIPRATWWNLLGWDSIGPGPADDPNSQYRRAIDRYNRDTRIRNKKMPAIKMQRAMRSSRNKRQAAVAKARGTVMSRKRMANASIRSGRLLRSAKQKRYRSSMYSKSSGFVNTGRKMRKYTLRTNGIYKGVTRVIETSSLAVDPECVYIGHATPLYQVKYMVWWALMKHLYVKAGAAVQGFADTTTLVNCFSSVGDIIRVIYKQTADSAVATSDFTVAAGSTVNNLVDNWATLAALNDDGVVIFDVRYIPLTTPTPVSFLNHTIIRTEGTYVELMMKYDLKMQNRTVTVASDDSVEEVNNAPIYGRSYEGPGVGTRFRSAAITTALTANVNTGVIVQGAASLGTPLNEPLDYQFFANVKKIGKIHLDGGQLKTSVLTKKSTFQIGNILNILNAQSNDAGSTVSNADKSYITSKLSTFRFFAVEKIMDANPAGALTNVQVAFEHNVKMTAVIKEYPQNSTQISFIKNRI